MRIDRIEKAASDGEKSAEPAKDVGVVSAFEAASTVDFATYVFDHMRVFSRSAEVRKLKLLTYLLEMATIEAARLKDKS